MFDGSFIAKEMMKMAGRDALKGWPERGSRNYVLPSGDLTVTAMLTEDALLFTWTLDGAPLSRASAEQKIAANTARVSGR